jgi:hypothetical protein
MRPVDAVADIGVLAQHLETVQQTRGDVQVPEVFVVEAKRRRMTERRRVRPSVDYDIVDRAAGASHQLRLASPGPAVQPTHDPALGSGLGILDESVGIDTMRGSDVGVERPGEEAAVVAVRRGYEDEDAVDRCRTNLHRSIVPFRR